MSAAIARVAMPAHMRETPQRLYADLTVDELRAEKAFWDGKIADAEEWGAVLSTARACSQSCALWIEQRQSERKDQAR